MCYTEIVKIRGKKNMKNSRRIFLFFVLIIALLVMTACSTTEPATDAPDEPEEVGTIIFGDAGWDSNRLHNAIAQFILEEGYGYDTDVIPGSSVNLIEGTLKGDVDIQMEMWQDNMPTYKEYRDAGKLIELGTNFDDNAQGIYVPRYIIEGDADRGIEAMAPDLKNIKDLAKYADLFPDPEDPGRALIINGPPSWEVTGIVAAKTAFYGLDELYNVVGSGSSASLAASLSAAYEKGEPWVGYYWEPTWITGKYDLVLLEDEPYDLELWNEESGFACSFKPVDVVIDANIDFVERAPDIAEFLGNYTTSSLLTAQALAYMQDNDAEIEEAAKWFLTENESLWKDWVPEEAYQKVMEALQ
jgi:glycine betaine/proline transport system substrate-binding protein